MNEEKSPLLASFCTIYYTATYEDIAPYHNSIFFSSYRDENSALGSDFKVILLQRDPRATINSLSEELQEWLPGATSPQKICGKILQDYTTVMNVSEVEKNTINTSFYCHLIV